MTQQDKNRYIKESALLLAEPVKVPSDEEIVEMMVAHGWSHMDDEDRTDIILFARALLARYGQPAQQPVSGADGLLDVDDLAQEIRRVDGRHTLGAAALAEALMPFLARHFQPQPSGDAASCGAMERALAELVDKIVPGLDTGDLVADAATASKALSAQSSGNAGELQAATDGGRNMLYEGQFEGETERERAARLVWADDMRGAFERHTGNAWFDKDWKRDTALWAACWRAALAAQASGEDREDTARMDALEAMGSVDLVWLSSDEVELNADRHYAVGSSIRAAIDAARAAEKGKASP